MWYRCHIADVWQVLEACSLHAVHFSSISQFEQCHRYLLARACLWPDRVGWPQKTNDLAFHNNDPTTEPVVMLQCFLTNPKWVFKYRQLNQKLINYEKWHSATLASPYPQLSWRPHQEQTHSTQTQRFNISWLNLIKSQISWVQEDTSSNLGIEKVLPPLLFWRLPFTQ
jgi:hypothetical protein